MSNDVLAGHPCHRVGNGGFCTMQVATALTVGQSAGQMLNARNGSICEIANGAESRPSSHYRIADPPDVGGGRLADLLPVTYRHSQAHPKKSNPAAPLRDRQPTTSPQTNPQNSTP